MVLARSAGALVAAALFAACGGGHSATPASTASETVPPTTTEEPGPRADAWPMFGYDSARSNVFPASTGITAANVAHLKGRQVALPGTADSSPIFVPPNLLVLTTSYGKVVAVDAKRRKITWTFVPDGIEDWEGTSQITQSSPVADAKGEFVYSYSPDGHVHKLRLADGHEVRSGDWPAVITNDPGHEKSAPPLNLGRGLVLAATGGYLGDAPPYQGHVVAIDADSGRLVNVFNTLCSDREGLLAPTACAESARSFSNRSSLLSLVSTRRRSAGVMSTCRPVSSSRICGSLG